MRKNTLLLKNIKRLDWILLFQMSIAIVIGLSRDPKAMLLILLQFVFLYQRSEMEYLLFSTLLIVSSCFIGYDRALLYLFMCVIFAFIAYVYQKFKWPIQKHLIVINPLIMSGVGFVLYGNTNDMYLLVGMMMLLQYAFSLILEKEQEDVVLRFSYITLLYLWLMSTFPIYAEIIILGYAIICAYLLPINLVFFILFYLMMNGFNYMYGMYLLLISNNRNQRVFLSFLSWFTLILSFDLYHLFFACICTMLGMLSYESNTQFMQSSELVEKEHKLYMEHSFYRQIVNYANVFYDLSSYYEDRSEENAQMLKRMGEAMEYNAKISKRYFSIKSGLKTRIKEILCGYHFEVLDCDVKDVEDKIVVQMDLSTLYEGEMEEIIIPLLEKICNCSFRLTQFSSYPFQSGKYKVVLESEAYAVVSTYGNSIHVHEISGDSYHSFLMDPHVVLMLSDGMGQGLKARKTSMILIKIMEAMMRCNIPQVECIKLLNLFLRSDLYATLDVLSLDRRMGKAYLSKSASAPTYLVREENLYEMSAHSLPIGIVDHVQADVYEIPFQKGDIFVMCSDGVEKEEVEKWGKLKRSTLIKNDGLNLINIIKERKRMDDSTILMAKID